MCSLLAIFSLLIASVSADWTLRIEADDSASSNAASDYPLQILTPSGQFAAMTIGAGQSSEFISTEHADWVEIHSSGSVGFAVKTVSVNGAQVGGSFWLDFSCNSATDYNTCHENIRFDLDLNSRRFLQETCYTETVGACRGGESPQSNAGLKFYMHRNCETLCDADPNCTGYALPVSGSNWCETYTSVGATGDGRTMFTCHMKDASAAGCGGEPENQCYAERNNKEDPDTVEAKLLEVICLCDDYRSTGFTWELNELSDDLESKVEDLRDAGGSLTASSPTFLKKWKKRLGFAAHLHDNVDVGTVDFFHRRVWRKVCRAIKRPQQFLIKAAKRLDAMQN